MEDPSLWSDHHTLDLLSDGWQDTHDSSGQAAGTASNDACVEN